MMTRTVRLTAGAAALAVLLAALVASPAQAAAYRYWTYWQGSGSSEWEFGRLGPAAATPADGDVEGWSFRVSVEGGTAEAAPTTAPDFDELCGSVKQRGGIKRIGLVVDPGEPALAPEGETPIAPVATCVVIEEDATGYDVLRSVLQVRTDNGLICGLGGYPAQECAPVLDDAEVDEIRAREAAAPTAGDPRGDSAEVSEVIVVEHGGSEADETDQGTAAEAAASTSPGPTATVLVVVALLLIAGILLVIRRRRERSDA